MARQVFLDELIYSLGLLDKSLSESLLVPKWARNMLMWIEWTVHGAPWLILSSLSLVNSYSRKWDEQTQHRLLILNVGLLIDLIVVGALKLSVQRIRPPSNVDDQIYEAPVADRFSFPSGHTSRAAMLFVFFSIFTPICTYAFLILLLVVAYSRVAMGRHYVSDVISGIILGLIIGKLVLLMPLSVNTWLRKVFH